MQRFDQEMWTSQEVARLLALVERERLYYQEMLAVLPAGLAVVDSSQTIQSANRAFRRAFHLTAAEAAGRRIDEVIPGHEMAVRVKDVIETEEPQEFLLASTEARLYQVSILPLRNWGREDREDALVVIEEIPLDEQAKGRDLVAEAVEAALWELDPATGALVAANRRTQEMFGAAADWAGRAIEEDRERTAAACREALESGRPVTHEYRRRDEVGRLRWMKEILRATPEGRVAGITLDTTEERRSAFERALDEKMTALSSMAARVSHDANNLLMIVTGYGEDLLAALPPGDARRADLEEILKASDRLAALSGQMLILGRQPAPQPREVSLAELMRQVDHLLDMAGTPGPAPVWADPTQAAQAISQLAGWLKETTGAAVSSWIEGTSARLFTGEGPADPVLDVRLFDPPAKSPGLGLAPTYMALRQNGIRVLPLGREGRIAGFELEFPVAGAAAQERAAAREPDMVLVVEDEEGIRGLIAKVLTRQGFQVLEAPSAEDALGLVETCGPLALVVTDVLLPQATGLELVARLRERRPDLKALLISGYTEDADLARGELPAGAAFLAKPFTLQALVAAVRALLDKPFSLGANA